MLIESTSYPYGSFEIYSELPPFELTRVKQTHSAIVHNTQSIEQSSELLEGDGICFDFKNQINFCIVTADCLPVLMLHEQGGFLLHAGWRGLHKKIHQHQSILNKNIHTIHIGPYIHGSSYEVGAEFLDYFGQGPWLTLVNEKWHFDQALWLQHDCSKHYPQAQIIISPFNTYTDLALHSFRREKQSCRNFNIWRPK